MSDEVLHVNTEVTEEKIIITDKPHIQQNILEIDTNTLSKKELLDFTRKDLESITKEKKLLKGIPDWKIKRMTKIDFVKLLKSEVKPKEKEVKKEDANINQAENSINIVLLQSAILDVVTKKDASNLDLFCQETIKNSNTELVSQDTLEKLNKSIVNFSIAHLTIRQFGGYKALFGKAKDLYKNLKEKRAMKNAN